LARESVLTGRILNTRHACTPASLLSNPYSPEVGVGVGVGVGVILFNAKIQKKPHPPISPLLFKERGPGGEVIPRSGSYPQNLVIELPRVDAHNGYLRRVEDHLFVVGAEEEFCEALVGIGHDQDHVGFDGSRIVEDLF